MTAVLPSGFTGLIASDIVTIAMKELGLLNSGQVPTGDELEDGLRSLSWMLKSWDAKGCNLWRQTENEIEYLEGVATMTLDPYALDVLECRLVQSSTFERPLMRYELGQYQALPNKAQPGWPSSYYLQKDVGGTALTLWPVPSQDVTIRFTYARASEDVTDGAQTIDVPLIWTEAVYVCLAARLVQQFGVTRTDPATAQVVAARAADLEQQMLDNDRPASVFMGVWGGSPNRLYNF